MTTVDLFQALWDSRASFDGLHVVRDGDHCTIFDPTKYVTMRDLDNNYAVPPPARMLQLSASSLQVRIACTCCLCLASLQQLLLHMSLPLNRRCTDFAGHLSYIDWLLSFQVILELVRKTTKISLGRMREVLRGMQYNNYEVVAAQCCTHLWLLATTAFM